MSVNLTELSCGSDLAYMLGDGGSFSPYKYKLLRGQDRLFVPCLKLLYNGETQLYYSCGRMRPFASAASSAEAGSFVTGVRNILSAFLELRDNGLVDCCDVDFSPEKIYVDPLDHSVRFIYLPLSASAFPGSAAPESRLRYELRKCMDSLPQKEREELNMLDYILSDSALSFRELLVKIEAVYGFLIGGAGFRSMKLISTNAPFPIELIVNKTPFVIGRSSTGTDGTLSFSRSISRIHCEISLRDGVYHVTDLGSKGGTAINRAALPAHEAKPISNGDELEISGYVFRTVIE